MRCIKLPNVQNLVPSARASISFPLGACYQKLYFSLGTTGLTKAFITNIVLKINNKEFQRWNSAADLDVMNTYKGNAINASYLVVDFTERLARTEAGLSLGAVAACQEAGVQSFTMEFDVGAFTVTGGTAPIMYADVDAPSANRILTRVQMQQKALSAAVQDMVYVPFGPQGFQIKRQIVKHVNLASWRVRRDGVEIYEDLPVALANFREQDFGRVPVAGYHVVDFMPDTLNSNALNSAYTTVGQNAVPVQNLDCRVTTSLADTLTIYTEGFALNSQL
jgi:hypothetical protein